MILQAVAQSTPSHFAVLSLIVAPAILTNACSVLIMSTSNRVARAVDLSRQVGRELDAVSTGDSSAESRQQLDELSAAHTRSVLLVRALRALYTALGGFSSATLLALLGVVFESQLPSSLFWLPEVLAAVSGVVGVGGIVWAAVLMLRETRIAVTALELRNSAQRARFPEINAR